MVEKRIDNTEDGEIVKKKISIKQTPEEEAKAKEYFQTHIFEDSFKENLKNEIKESKPYKWGTIKNLINDELLRNVRNEIIKEIEFTKKETDIYKVYQSGDLANLSAMPEDLLKRIPSMYKLRSAIYSEKFRSFISEVTGCGKLSGIKTDLSIQLYTKSCHLLTHDDVIGSRRISFILYMPDPDKKWKSHYGGALQLFDSLVPNVPKSDINCKLIPEFNQIAFFKVEPGLSFHAVEEVKVDKQRLSLQGWFHIPQFGEEGFIKGEQEETEKFSTLKQLESKELKEFDFPKFKFTKIPDYIDKTEEGIKLNEFDLKYLKKFINLNLLETESINRLNKIFNEESVVDIMSFLNKDYENLLKSEIKSFELNEFPSMPKNELEVENLKPWKLAIPSHKKRFMYIDGYESEDIKSIDEINYINKCRNSLPNFSILKDLFKLKEELVSRSDGNDSERININKISFKLCELSEMFKSKSFQKWINLITDLKLVKDNLLIRRFRPGLDFILATKDIGDNDVETSENYLSNGILEATLNLTPTNGWETGDFGGYELCLLDDTESDLQHEKREEEELNEDEAAIYRKADQDSVVYESQASWNKLSLMFRDNSVMKFVKYVSYEAPGSRWDIACAWKCEDEEEDEQEEGEGEEN